MCKGRNILWDWHCTKNAHSSHGPLEMESYQTADYAPPLIAAQTFTELQKQQKESEMDRREQWQNRHFVTTEMTNHGGAPASKTHF